MSIILKINYTPIRVISDFLPGNPRETTCPCRLSIAIDKHREQKQLGEERLHTC